VKQSLDLGRLRFATKPKSKKHRNLV
jgi:hypothetical protein